MHYGKRQVKYQFFHKICRIGNFNDRAQYTKIVDTLIIKIGKNLLVNWVSLLNNEINYGMMNISYNSNKIKCKENFVTN